MEHIEKKLLNTLYFPCIGISNQADAMGKNPKMIDAETGHNEAYSVELLPVVYRGVNREGT